MSTRTISVLSSQVSIVFLCAFNWFHTGIISKFLFIELDELWKTPTVLNKLCVDVDPIRCVLFNSLPLLPLKKWILFCCWVRIVPFV